jgi:hypothetical protein
MPPALPDTGMESLKFIAFGNFYVNIILVLIKIWVDERLI